MSERAPNNTEGKQTLEDNARKFVVGAIDADFLKQQSATSFALVVDWVIVGEDNEQKVAYKSFEDGRNEIILISKIISGNKRTAERKKITKDEYDKLLLSSVRRIEKKRYEFNIIQNNVSFSIKYDEFVNSELRIIEVDASSEAERNSFDSVQFPVKLSEVTGDMRYYGFRVTEVV